MIWGLLAAAGVMYVWWVTRPMFTYPSMRNEVFLMKEPPRTMHGSYRYALWQPVVSRWWPMASRPAFWLDGTGFVPINSAAREAADQPIW